MACRVICALPTWADMTKPAVEILSPNSPQTSSRSLDVQQIRKDFPILASRVHGKPLIYLDNAATTQKPLAVIDRIERYYREENANIHRGVYQLSQQATAEHDAAREKVRRFINAEKSAEIIFTRGTTEGINLVAASWGRAFLKPGDEVIVSHLEHHSNIVPWQMICDAVGAKLRVIPINDAGELRLDEYAKLLNDRTRMVAVNHVSNSLGTINDVKAITAMAHRVGAKVLIDGAQWVAHFATDVQEIGCDFYAFSGHKLYGPTGIGVLYARRELLEAMPPYHGGGDMIESVTFEKTVYADVPEKFEAGTPNIAGAIGLGAAIDYVLSIGFEKLHAQEQGLLNYATEQMRKIPGLRLVGTAARKAGVISFLMENPPLAPLDLGMLLDRQGVAVRTGHHCCQPVMDRFGIPGTARVSLAMYNTRADIDALIAALKSIRAAGKPAAPAVTVSTADARYPTAVAASPQTAADDLAEMFEFLGDWEARDQEIIHMGEKLLPMPIEFKTEDTRVKGCMSTVHLVGRKRPGTDDVFEFLADSDAHLVRGLIAILQRLFSGQRATDVVAFETETFLKRVGLDQHLSMGRRSGLAGMIQRIRSIASAIAKGNP
jgi:cysteine desulfurase/selenocysteine lyase